MAKRASGVGLERQALRLLVGDHLQPMLDARAERRRRAESSSTASRVDPAFGVQLGEHVERARAAHRRPPAAEDELLRLDEELDLADAAAPELDVVAGTVTCSWPRTAWICRFIAWMSAIAA